MAEIERFDCEHPRVGPGDGCEAIMESWHGGDWVRYSDHLAVLEELAGELEGRMQKADEGAGYADDRSQADWVNGEAEAYEQASKLIRERIGESE